MIELEQKIESNGIRFTVKGEKQEIQYMQDWLAFYGQESKLQLTSDLPEDDFGSVRAEIFLDEDVNEKLNRIDFASLFKLTFAKFELDLPDASNSECEAIARLEALVDALSDLPKDDENGLDRDTLDVIKDELGLK